LIPVRVFLDGGGPPALTFECGTEVRFPGYAHKFPGSPSKVILGIRPEHIMTNREDLNEGAMKIEVVVDVIEPTGADTYAIFQLGGREVTARMRPGQGQVGVKTRFWIDSENVVLFDKQSGNRIAP
ncbi:TOBE domain-containing protein, partial [Mesorhizobium sp. M7A.F.Ca.US.011.01.1.1]|uniref:TOBE domain-containing protein n=1 Tax=Mesorhizobium sp. M7A.F.Ca.US.011.01.1.1 TaxID=2496741 RepID=UPI000FCB468F